MPPHDDLAESPLETALYRAPSDDYCLQTKPNPPRLDIGWRPRNWDLYCTNLSNCGSAQPIEHLGLAKVFIGELTYQECALRGSSSVVFKWVPEHVASRDQLEQTPCGGDCVDTCVAIGCTCLNGVCV